LREGKVRFAQFIAATSLALVCALTPARAEKRVALVIGNDRYANLPAHDQLQKAVNDARAVGGALKQIGFEVMSGENVGRQAPIDKFDETARQLSHGDVVFFFFAGQGVTVDGSNCILPADVPDVEKGHASDAGGVTITAADDSGCRRQRTTVGVTAGVIQTPTANRRSALSDGHGP
jgi:uncharacterized caspase-like protein